MVYTLIGEHGRVHGSYRCVIGNVVFYDVGSVVSVIICTVLSCAVASYKYNILFIISTSRRLSSIPVCLEISFTGYPCVGSFNVFVSEGYP